MPNTTIATTSSNPLYNITWGLLQGALVTSTISSNIENDNDDDDSNDSAFQPIIGYGLALLFFVVIVLLLLVSKLVDSSNSLLLFSNISLLQSSNLILDYDLVNSSNSLVKTSYYHSLTWIQLVDSSNSNFFFLKVLQVVIFLFVFLLVHPSSWLFSSTTKCPERC